MNSITQLNAIKIQQPNFLFQVGSLHFTSAYCSAN